MIKLTSDALLLPDGDLDVEWFDPKKPSEVRLLLDKALATGYASADTTAGEQLQHDTAKAYAYWKGYGVLAGAMARKPADITVAEANDTTTRRFSADQLQFFIDMRDSWQQIYTSLVPSVVEAVDSQPSMSVKNKIRLFG